MNLLDNPIIEIEIILLLAFLLVFMFLSMVLLIGKMIFGECSLKTHSMEK